MIKGPAPGLKPFVQVACICEKALIEPDNVVSLIRIVDTYTLDIPAELPPGVGGVVDLTAFVSLKSGDVVGEYEVALQLKNPDGQAGPIRKWPVVFNGGEHGVNVKISFTLQSPKHGLYWFDVLWGDEVLTKIPFRLKPKAAEPSAGGVEPNEAVMRQKKMSS